MRIRIHSPSQWPTTGICILYCVVYLYLDWLLQGVQDLAPAVGHRGQGTLREGQPGPPADIHVTGKIFYGF